MLNRGHLGPDCMRQTGLLSKPDPWSHGLALKGGLTKIVDENQGKYSLSANLLLTLNWLLLCYTYSFIFSNLVFPTPPTQHSILFQNYSLSFLLTLPEASQITWKTIVTKHGQIKINLHGNVMLEKQTWNSIVRKLEGKKLSKVYWTSLL